MTSTRAPIGTGRTYYTDDFDEDDVDTLCLTGVPDGLADDLCEQGSSGQVFADGYEAWQAALPYWRDGAR